MLNTEINILENYISRAQLAEQLGRTERTLIRWQQERTGPPVTVIGRRVLYHVPAVLAWLRSQEQPMVRERARRR